MRWLALGLAAFMFAALAPTGASAQNGYATADVNMRAGPGTRYPVVTTIPRNHAVRIYGCTQGYSWCDVSWGRYRGWVYARYLAYSYAGRQVYVPDYGARIGLPIITFGFGNYWDRHYRHRSWYRDRNRWDPRYHHRYDRRDDRRDWNRDHRRRDWNRDQRRRDWRGDRRDRRRDGRRDDRRRRDWDGRRDWDRRGDRGGRGGRDWQRGQR